MVDRISDHQPRGWRRDILDPVGHHILPRQCGCDAALLGLGRRHDLLVGSLIIMLATKS
jgi:hypothetical protein